MLKRRQFIQQSAALSLGGLLTAKSFSSLLHTPLNQPAGLQLFTLFGVLDKDVPGGIKKIAEVGYKEIESAFSMKGGFYGMSAKDFASLLKDNGLSWKSHHVLGTPFVPPPGMKMPNGPDGKPMVIPKMNTLKDEADIIINEMVEGGVEWLVCANITINTPADIKTAVEILNKTDEACKKKGLKFAYHNHDWEFKPVEGKIPYDIFLKETQVKMELDLAWAIKGGQDPVAMFKKDPGRYPLWHVKDLDSTHENILPVGSGTLDFKRIFAASESAGLEYYFIEHDMPKDAWASIQESIVYLKKLAPVS